MRSTEAICLALWLALCSSATVKGQNEPSLSSRIMEALKAKEPGWKPIALIENRVLLVPSERRILAAAWVNPTSHLEDVNVFVYTVDNRTEATAWLRPVRNKQVAVGWQVAAYPIGDEGYLSKYKDRERQHPTCCRFEIALRRGNVVAWVKGNDLRGVRDAAKCVVDQIPPN